MADQNSLFVARESDVTDIKNIWSEAHKGNAQLVRLQAPFGGGRRALLGEVFRQITDTEEDAVIWRVNCVEQENGLQWLVRMYGSLLATLTSDILQRGRAEMALNAQLPSQPKRVQGWYQEFISSLKESKPDKATGQIQLRMPRDNPFLGLIEVVAGLSRRLPFCLEIQNPNIVHSVALAQFVEALSIEASQTDCRLMIILHDEPESDRTKALFPAPLLDFYARRQENIQVHSLAEWGEEETAAYLASRELDGPAKRIVEIANGRPGFVAELVDICVEQELLGTDLKDVSLYSLVPMDVDTDELEEPEAPAKEGERKHATAEDAATVAHLAALLGQAFPSGIVADMGGYDRESVDDLLDAMGGLFSEVQFNKELGTWIYKFNRGSWREGILEHHRTDEGADLARRAGMFMERFLVPRGAAFISKTARVYAENGAGNRALMLRSMLLAQDASDVWGLCYDTVKYFDEVEWPDPLLRTLYMNLLENLVGSGPIEAAEKVHQEATTWATEREDREMTAWLLFNGSRLDARRQDFYRARDRGNDALKLYTALENKQRCAEIYNHLGAIELQDGKPEEAMQQIQKAVEVGQVEGPEGQKALTPNVFAHSEQIRGTIARRSGDPKQAAQHFRNANEAAGRAGLAMLALDSGLGFGEALLAGGEVEQAQDALARVAEIARQVKNPMRERNACELAAQAHGARREWPKAIEYASRTLQLTQSLKFNRALPIDLHNMGFFLLASGKVKEAAPFLAQAEGNMASMGEHPVVKECLYFSGMARIQTGDIDGAKTSFTNAIPHLENHKDWPKYVAAMSNLAAISQQGGDSDTAKKLLGQAMVKAESEGLKTEKKEIKKRLDALS